MICKFCGYEIAQYYDPLKKELVWYHKQSGQRSCKISSSLEKATPKEEEQK